jgi:hypothetical protein
LELTFGFDSGVLTVELNTSMIALPKVPMRKRSFDPRVGFANQYDVFEEESQKSEKEVFAVDGDLSQKMQKMLKNKKEEN